MIDPVPSTDAYAFPRNAPETIRLNEQHYQIVGALGFLIHPSIPTDSPSLRVADIACGSGIWLMEIAKNFPHARCDGFDISSHQFPSKDELSTEGLDRVDFHVHDAADAEGPGAGFVSQFDIVAVRLAHVSFVGEQWDQAVKNAVAMLKPGGYIQWIDWNMLTTRIVQNQAEVSTRGLEKLLSGFKAVLATRDVTAVDRLPQMFNDHGVENLAAELYPMDAGAEIREYFARTFVETAPMVIRKGLEGDDEWSEERKRSMTDDAAAEQEAVDASSRWLRWEIWCYVGKKA